jgi:hypothetical protein
MSTKSGHPEQTVPRNKFLMHRPGLSKLIFGFWKMYANTTNNIPHIRSKAPKKLKESAIFERGKSGGPRQFSYI